MTNLTAAQAAALAKIVEESQAELNARFPGDGSVIVTSEHGSKRTIDALIRKGALVLVSKEQKSFEVQRDFGRDAPRRAFYNVITVRPA
jgi:putative heme iron utilization protein